MTEDFLLTIAEVAVALIGFSGIVTVLGRRGKGEWQAEERVRLLALTEPSAVALAGALFAATLPMILTDADTIWRTSNAAVFAFHSVAFAAYIKRSRGLDQLLSQKILALIAIVILLILAASVIDIHPYHEYSLALGLLLGIAVGVFNFLLLLFHVDHSD